MGRKNQIKSEILEVISSSPNGVSPKEIMKEIGGSESALFYNLKQLKEKGKIINKDHKYFEKNSKNKINLDDPRHVSGFRAYKTPLINKVMKFINEKEGIKFSELKIENRKKILNKYKKILTPISRFENVLINSIHVSYEGKKPFYLRDYLNNKIIQKIQELISDFIFYPEIFLNLNSLSDLEFTFEISFGNDLEKELSKFHDYNFSEFKETVINNWGIFLDKLKFLEQYDQITKDQFLKRYSSIMGEQGRIDFIKRNEREIYMKKQIKKIERRIYSFFPIDKDETIDISFGTEGLYRKILQLLLFLDLEEIDAFQTILTTITKMFLDNIKSKKDVLDSIINKLSSIKSQEISEVSLYDLVNDKLQRSGFFNDFIAKIKPFINNYNKKHEKEIKEKFGFNIHERIPEEIAYKKFFDKFIEPIKRKK